ncbi:MAG: PilZ domain-containing protein [bacterium]|nr:hypothetical protein [Deltaproteobacteria bacterium]MCP4907792.1 PilZ domain-containing protein [bacterium]
MALSRPGILLVDDGELDEVARVLDRQGIAYERLRGGRIPNEVAPPMDLLIVTPRRVERVRRGSPAAARPGRPLRIIAANEDSPAMRRRLRRSGLHLLIRLPAAPEIWRLLIARALYRGSERRVDARVAVGSPVALGRNDPRAPKRSAALIDLSNRGCRLQTSESLSVGDSVEFTIPVNGGTWCEPGPLTLRGEVRRSATMSHSADFLLAVAFEASMPESIRTRLTALINQWASGPLSSDRRIVGDAPPIPPCRLPSLPDLTLDDETDPPILANSEVRVSLETQRAAGAQGTEPTTDRRQRARGRFQSPLVVERDEGPFVLIGRDLSASGMRVEPHPDLHVGDRFRIGLHGPGPGEPHVLAVEVVRDDGPNGFGLVFDEVDEETARELEKMVACLPDVESLEDGEIAGLGAILSEIMSD